MPTTTFYCECCDTPVCRDTVAALEFTDVEVGSDCYVGLHLAFGGTLLKCHSWRYEGEFDGYFVYDVPLGNNVAGNTATIKEYGEFGEDDIGCNDSSPDVSATSTTIQVREFYIDSEDDSTCTYFIDIAYVRGPYAIFRAIGSVTVGKGAAYFTIGNGTGFTSTAFIDSSCNPLSPGCSSSNGYHVGPAGGACGTVAIAAGGFCTVHLI